jgi:hypothetical protein
MSDRSTPGPAPASPQGPAREGSSRYPCGSVLPAHRHLIDAANRTLTAQEDRCGQEP